MCSFFAVFLFILRASSFVTADQLQINTIVDVVLDSVVSSLEESSLTSISVPDTEKDFKVSFIKGGIKFTRGVLSDFSTLSRTGDAILTVNDDSATLDISMGLTTMELYYEHVRAWLGALSTSEKLSISVGKNSIEAIVSITISSDNTCKTTLNSVTLKDFGDFQFDLKSLGKIKYVANHIADWIIDDFNSNINKLVENMLFNILSTELAEADLCSLI